MASTMYRSGVRSTATGATDEPTHASATTASDAGAIAVRTGSAVSGTTSVRRAAQRWNGIAPKRIATAVAKARYASPKTTGCASSWLRSRPIQAVAAIARAPGDDDGPRLHDADRRAGTTVARRQRDQDAEQPAGRGGEDRQARIHQCHGQGGRPEDRRA